MANSYYEVLGVDRNAGTEEIKKAFRRVARETHPDANPGDPEAEARFREAAEAYEVLSDPERRRRYDRGDSIDLSGLFSGFGGFDDLIRSVFGDAGPFGGASPRTARGRDVLVRVEVDLAGAAFGTEAPVSFRTSFTCPDCGGSGAAEERGRRTCPECGGGGSVRMARRSLFGTMMTVGTCPTCRGEGIVVTNPCPTCRGTGAVEDETTVSVEIPPGVSTGTRLRVSGHGEVGTRLGAPGDLYVEVRVKPDPRFERSDSDLIHPMTIGMAEAALGTVVAVPLLEGGETELEIPPGTQPGTVFRIPGLGMGRLGRRGRGDLLVPVSVEIPADLGEEEEELLRRWAELRGERTNRPASAA